jgi:AcrR family transcriptional regulator
MPRRAPSPPGPREDRGVLAARILDAARASFAARGPAGTTIRAVARDADVDPALVYHYFKSKSQLLEKATEPPLELVTSAMQVWQSPLEELGRALVANLLRIWSDRASRPTMEAILLTAAHEETTRERLKVIVETSLMGPATAAFPEAERATKASLIASQMLGLAMSRYVWRIEPLASMTDDEIIDHVGPSIQRYVDLVL